ncbi:solute carrier organic anion transporter family member 3A1-like [Liolophura sinensis]|uniref:solute carrier organic anion transporter family member 3A1-like n=1 Tax=Liolophura sinensis TaxID=3198878 RepID=UPI00315814AB
MASQSADEQFVPLENDEEGAFKKATLYSETDTNPSMRCGMFCFSPSWLQVFSNMRSFSMYYGVCSLVTSALTAYLTSQVTTLEKQYGLSSSETGLLLSMNDIGFLVFVLIISLFSRYSNKPKILGIGVLVFGLSAILSALPHFAVPGLLVKDVSATNSSQERQLVPKSSQRLGDVTLCSDNNELLHGESSWNISADSERTCSSRNVENQSTSKFLVLFLISVGLFLQGMAKAPRLPVTYSFIDDNVVRTKTGLFAGVIGFLAIFGPTIAFIVGARVSRIYVTLEDVPFSRSDPRWVGAWWLGFVIFGSAAILLSGPLFMFPRKMRINSRNSDRQRLARQQQQSVDKKMAALQQIKDIPGAFRRLLTNYNFMSILIAGSLDMMAMAGGLAFAPKYLEVFFGLSIYKANMLQGITTFIAGAVGMLTGGFLVSKLKLSLAGCLKLIVVVRLISSLSSGVALLLNCPEVEVVGMSHLSFKPKRIGKGTACT